MCQHMQRADMESYGNRMNQREVEEEVIKEKERGVEEGEEVSSSVLFLHFHCRYIRV